jgi:hypothetical protein
VRLGERVEIPADLQEKTERRVDLQRAIQLRALGGRQPTLPGADDPILESV